jgi:uncharacterized protein YijF (DUF1287 family)
MPFGFCMAFLLISAPQPAAVSGVRLVAAARSQVGVTLSYDGSYRRIPYPGGDVPLDRGVCTDVVVRAYRKLGLDLQSLVHRDMVSAWPDYPNLWRMKGPDPNIDHRRVPNLAAFFRRHGQVLANSQDPKAYAPGDLVTWRLISGLPHIGIVSDRSTPGGVPRVIHNIGAGAKEEDILFAYAITGHFRYPPGSPEPPHALRPR